MTGKSGQTPLVAGLNQVADMVMVRPGELGRESLDVYMIDGRTGTCHLPYGAVGPEESPDRLVQRLVAPGLGLDRITWSQSAVLVDNNAPDGPESHWVLNVQVHGEPTGGRWVSVDGLPENFDERQLVMLYAALEGGVSWQKPLVVREYAGVATPEQRAAWWQGIEGDISAGAPERDPGWAAVVHDRKVFYAPLQFWQSKITDAAAAYYLQFFAG